MVMRAVPLSWMIVMQLGAAALAAAPEPYIRIEIDGSRHFLGDTVLVDIEATGLVEPLDFSALEAVGEIGRRTVGTRIAVFGGRVVEIRSIRIELTPRAVGDQTIGPVVAGEVVSNAVSIEVSDERPSAWKPGSDDIDIAQTVSEARPWLQEELVLDIRVRHRHPVFEEDIALPDLSGLGAVPVFTDRRTIEQADGGWTVIAWRYLLHPEHSGAIEIAPARYAATLARSRAERARVSLQSERIVLDVRPAAKSGVWWLPARNLSMTDTWSKDPTTLSAGDEVERVITVEAIGVRPEQLPDVAMDETRGLLVTPAGEERTSTIGETGTKARADFRFKIRALSPTAIFVDTIRLVWWDTLANAPRETIVPARRIEIGMPDRERLIEAVGGDGLRAPVGIPWSIGAAAFLLAIAAVSAIILARRRSRSPADRKLIEAARAIARKQPAVALEALRVAGRLGPSRQLAAIRERLEGELFAGGGIAEPDGLSRNLRRAARRRAPSPETSALPPL